MAKKHKEVANRGKENQSTRTLPEYFAAPTPVVSSKKQIFEGRLPIQIESRDNVTVEDHKVGLEDIDTSEEKQAAVLAKKTKNSNKTGTNREATGKSKPDVEQSVYTNPDDTFEKTTVKKGMNGEVSKAKEQPKVGQIPWEDSNSTEQADTTEDDDYAVSRSHF